MLLVIRHVEGSNEEKMINKTQLDICKAEEREIVHRDYIAHCLRWTHILKNADVGETILDIGCGDAPLAMTFYSNKFKPSLYVGVDIRKSVIEKNQQKKFNFDTKFLCLNVLDQFDSIPDEKYSILACLEMIEHIEAIAAHELLKKLAARIQPGAILYVSTPCYNQKDKAANHVHEFTFKELRDILDELFVIESVNGTFISQKDFYEVASFDHVKVFEELKRYYDSNLCSILLAPLYPHRSRNCIWTLRKK